MFMASSKMASTLSWKWLTTFWYIWYGTARCCSNFTDMWFTYSSNNVWRDFRLPVSAFTTVARKVYGNPTRVTRLKVAQNLTEPTSTKHSVSSLKCKSIRVLLFWAKFHRKILVRECFFFWFMVVLCVYWYGSYGIILF